ncbi:endopeptidase La [Lachnospiraceae bacterium OttesenSCG-928-J05]|nr:endopeptidase La [Lachnospiraceae bacterium OttesenSCG-928-J05]
MIVIPVYNKLVLPEATTYILNDEISEKNLQEIKEGEKVILLLLKKPETEETLNAESFYQVGVSGVVGKSQFENYTAIDTEKRVNIDDVYIGKNGDIELSISKREDVNDIDEEELKGRLRQIKAATLDYAKQFQGGQMAAVVLARWTSFEQIASSVSMWLTLSNEERYEIIREDSKLTRSQMIEKVLYEALEIANLNQEANEVTNKDYQKLYRESAIKKQMDYLQKELDEMHPENVSDIQKFQKKIEASKMNDVARKEANKVLNRMKQEGQNSSEYGILYDYLDFVTGLSWETEKAKKIDLDYASEVLDEEHFGMKKVKDRVIQQIAVMNLKKKQSGSILLFIGAPGTGKTSIGQNIAKALKREYVRVSLGGVRDEADIRGHRRTYIGAMPGRIMDGISKSGVSNPVVVLDEVDKIASSYHGDPASALLEVLDPEQNHTFTDHYMNVPYDLSNVMFICTANSLETIPEPLLNRMEVIQFQGYTATDKFQIARKHLLPKAMKAMGVNEKHLEITDEALMSIIENYTMESGVRGLKKRLDTLCRITAVELVKGTEDKITVTVDNVKAYLDAKPIRHGKIIKEKKPGIVTGLAWTAAGGDILFIETMFTPGNGKVIITGQLESVMEESVKVAISLVKSIYPDKADLFKENDLHIHIPEGAVKKDGPSAGITLTTALASLIQGKAVSPELAMTGEISLRGKVMPIGGLPEKLMAAQRAGVTTVLIPDDNEIDLEDVDDEVKDKLEIKTVKTIDEVLGIALR